MARPNPPQFLRKGRLLASAIFPTFVDTWNWIVHVTDSFAGDLDVNPQGGCITVDRTNQDKPIIRLDQSKLVKLQSTFNGRFAISEAEGEGEDNSIYLNTYYNVGGHTYAMTGNVNVNKENGIEALVIQLGGSLPSASVQHYATITEMQNAQQNLSTYIVPLYSFTDGEVSCDWRLGPEAAMGEFAQ